MLTLNKDKCGIHHGPSIKWGLLADAKLSHRTVLTENVNILTLISIFHFLYDREECVRLLGIRQEAIRLLYTRGEYHSDYILILLI
jgi:hypothetical protein